MSKPNTHFGYRQVEAEKKSEFVAEVFHSVAAKYDLMNDIMSFGLHRIWKRMAIQHAGLKQGQCVLDIASGTGDLAKIFAKLVGKQGKVVMSDINESMLTIGRDRLIDTGILGNLTCIQADAEHLPFTNNYFDCVSIAFGLRNMTDKTAALREMQRVLKPGGKIVILEFSHPKIPLLNQLYDFYSFHFIPKIGEVITKDKASYQYLVESIRMHPDQDTLKDMMLAAKFEDVDYINLNAGIVALHKGYKY